MVLTADLRWVRIENITVDTELIATDEDVPGGIGAGRKMRTATVEATREIFDYAFRLVMDNAQILIATGDHRFLTKIRGNVATKWSHVKHMRVGDEIRNVVKPWDAYQSYEDGWFAGILDGEGSLRAKDGAGAECSVAQVYGPVHDRIERYLIEKGYSYREEVEKREAGEKSKLGSKPLSKYVVSRMGEIFRLIGHTRPTRLMGKRWWEGKELPGRSKAHADAWSRIVSIELLGKRRMIDLQTSTGTFIAEGFVSHNSTLIEGMITWRAVLFWRGIGADRQ